MKFQQNDGGRSTSKRPKQKSDCVVRTIAIVSGLSYDAVYDTMAEMGRKCGRGTDKEIWKKYLNDSRGYHYVPFPAVRGVKRMNLADFAAIYIRGRFVVQMAGHLCAVIDGVVMDDLSSAPRRDACVYGVWRLDRILAAQLEN